MCMINESNFTAASLLVFSEILSTRADVRFELFQNRAQNTTQQSVLAKEAKVDSDTDDEKFQDVDRVAENIHKHQTAANKKQQSLVDEKFKKG